MRARRRRGLPAGAGRTIWVLFGILVIGGVWLSSKIGLANVMAILFVLGMIIGILRMEFKNLRGY